MRLLFLLEGWEAEGILDPGVYGDIRVRFTPQAWQNDYAIDVDPQGPTEWVVSADEVKQLVDRFGPEVLETSTDESDNLRFTSTAPEWVREWAGPFYCEVRRHDDPKEWRCPRCGGWARRHCAYCKNCLDCCQGHGGGGDAP